MTAARVETIKEIFNRAREVEPAARKSLLDQACAGDELLRREIEALLKSHEQADDFIASPPSQLAAELLTNEESASLIGSTIGNYKVLKRIGTGGMGDVYLAERADAEYEKQVAIKLIKRGMDTDSVLRHFRNERQILASFEHPNIARLLDGGATEDGLTYFVMEYVEGAPLDLYCDSRDLAVNGRLKLFREVCSAVGYAHRHAVIHRDIKLSNILVTADGTPKLLDFGVAKILQPGSGGDLSITLTGQRLMTPEFASPEQVRGEPVTTATDIYSLGMVLYLLLTGEKPYRLKARTAEEISRAVLEQEPVRPSTVVARAENPKPAIANPKLLRGDLDNIVLMALRKEAERRYQSVEQFSEDIRRHLDELPVLAGKDTFGYRTAKFVRRNSVATAAAALVLLSLLGGIVATIWQAQRAKAQEVLAIAEKNRAERRFNDVRRLAHSVLFDYHDAIKDLPGATGVREKLVKDALTYLDSLAGEAGGDLALQRELAAAYDRIGDVRGQPGSASLGDKAGAMDSYLKALRIRETLVAANPHDAELRGELAKTFKRIGWQLRGTSETSRGLEHLRRAVTLYDELAVEKPETAEFREELAYTCNLAGLLMADHGDWKGALDQHRRALALREKLAADHPDDANYRRGIAATYANIGNALKTSGDLSAALEMNQKSLALEEELVAEYPTNVSYRRMLAIGYLDNGDYRDELGDQEGALESSRKGMAIAEEMLAADAANTEACAEFAYSSQRVGDLLAARGDISQALVHYRKALQICDKKWGTAPEDLRAHLALAISRAGVAKMQARLGEKKAALNECDQVASLLGEVAEESTNTWHRGMKAQAYQYLGDTYVTLAKSRETPAAEATQDWLAARDMLKRRLNILEQMRSQGVITTQGARELDEVTAAIAQCDAALRQ